MVKKVSKLKTAKLYANAFYESAEAAGVLAQVLQDAAALKNAELGKINEAKYLNSPIVDFEQKKALLDIVAQKMQLNIQTANLLRVLVQNGDFDLLSLVIDDFFAMYNHKHNIAEITVETSENLNAEQDEKLKQKLRKIFNKNIKINYVIKPEIIGGLVIRNGTMLIDLSLKNKLKKLEQLMKGTD